MDDRSTGASVVLCWDVDGTLLTTARAGVGAWEQAFADVVGHPRDLSDYRTAGLTDVEIGGVLLADADEAGRPVLLEELVRRYEDLLPTYLPTRQGRVLPGVREFLDWNRAHRRVPCILLTGNTERGAKAKLTHYGLAQYFDSGAYSSLERGDRTSVARHACTLSRDLLGARFTPPAMVVIGDTPHDVACGKAVGARTIAVATGTYSVAELEATDPWRTIPALPAPDALMAMVGG